jgi:GPI mannosyltransferase 3
MQYGASKLAALRNVRTFLAALSFSAQSVTADGAGWSGLERRRFAYCLAASALLFLICSIFSVGTHNPDEYFQTVEFASTKLALTNPAELPWEYREQMRSWLQPAVYVGVARAAADLGIHRPLTLLFLYRLVTALVAWSSLWALIVAGRRWIAGETERRRLYAIAAFLWLLPFLGVRTSAESFATSALCFGIAALTWRATLPGRGGRFWLAVLGGLALGLCFEFRYPSGVMAASAGLCYLRPARERLSLFAGLVLGALTALALGAVADWWGYGHPTFPAFSYVYQNFVLGRSAREFGTAPFFAYLYLPLQEGGLLAPLVFTLLVATVTAWLARPGHVLTWASAPYVVLLSIASHKEARFLFPLIPFLPFFVIFALRSEQATAIGARLSSFVHWLLSDWRLKVAYLLNFGGLLSVVLLPQGANFPLYQLIENESYAAPGPLDIAVVARGAENMPYDYVGHHMAFIEPKNLRLILNPSVAQLEAKQFRGETFFALIDIPPRQPEPAAWIRSHCTFVWSTWPRWLEAFDFFEWVERSHWWEFYRCDGAVAHGAFAPPLLGLFAEFETKYLRREVRLTKDSSQSRHRI